MDIPGKWLLYLVVFPHSGWDCQSVDKGHWTGSSELLLQHKLDCFKGELLLVTTAYALYYSHKMLQTLSAGELRNQEQENNTATGAELFDACFNVFGLRGQNRCTTLSSLDIFNLHIDFIRTFNCLCNWVLNFLTDSQTWKRHASKSVGSGTPQGCVLGPLLDTLFYT